MRTFSIVVSILGLVATLAPAPAGAQTLHVNDAYSSSVFDLHPELTKGEFEEFTGELGSILRFRQLGDATTLGKGNVDVSVEFANTPIDDSKGAWNNTMSHPAADRRLGRSFSFPRVAARFGVSDRVDVGAWGGFAPHANYGLIGADTKIALLREGPARPVSVSIRPSFTSLIGPSEVLAGNVSVDLSVSRNFGRVAPYVGVAASSSAAIERSQDVDLSPATAGASLAYAGLSYRWGALVLSAEVEKGALVRYVFGIGTRIPSRRSSS